MGKKGGSKHLKRLPAPDFWPIHRKEYKWVVKPRPGPHPIDRCLPLQLILRDILFFAKTGKEVKTILSEGQVKVDGKVRMDEKFPVGLMDVIEIKPLKKFYRLLPAPRKTLTLHEIGEEEKGFKLCKVRGKFTVKGGNIQLNLHDGRNILIPVKDPAQAAEVVYKTSDVLKISIPNSEILDHIKFEEGVSALVTGGKNLGRYGKIVEIQRKKGPYPTVIVIENGNGVQFRTILNYVFAIGKEKPWISLPEVESHGAP